jgi:hypothetical protein
MESNQPTSEQEREYQLYLDERRQLIEAAKESARTFDKAVLTFGAAVFGASIAFIKDVAPHPIPDTLPWLGISWGMFTFALLSIMLSFLFSHQACHHQIDLSRNQKNPWSMATNLCNYLCLGLLFLGLLCWSFFAYKNLAKGEPIMGKDHPTKVENAYSPTPSPKPLEKAYVPPSPPKHPPDGGREQTGYSPASTPKQPKP